MPPLESGGKGAYGWDWKVRVMRRVLGVDAAWTDKVGSGVAVATFMAGARPRLEFVARCYVEAEALAGMGRRRPIDWHTPAPRAPEEPQCLAAFLRRFAPVDAVALDIPLASAPITGRRLADDEISRHYGGHGASTHSPSSTRPGLVSGRLFAELASAGLHFATAGCASEPGVFLETYPHPAIIELMGLDYRLCYKVSRRGRYWREARREEQLLLVAKEMDRLRDALAREFDGVQELIPSATVVVESRRRRVVALLKGIEDVLDAVVCAYAAIEFLEGRATGFGDRMSTIWVPQRQRTSGNVGYKAA